MRANKFLLNKESVQEFLKKESIEDSEDIVLELEQIIDKHLKSFAKEKRKLLNNEVYDEAVSFEEIYSGYDISILPIWIKENISEAHVIENLKQTVILSDNRRYQLNNKLNHLSGEEWIYFTNSVLNTAYKTSGEDSFAHKIRKIHPTPKPLQLMKSIIKFFTKK